MLPFLSLAQDWPAKSVRIVVPYPAGGGVDAAARLVAQHLSTVLGQSVVVDPKPGGGTVIGAEMVSRAAPDGYTFLLTGGSTMSLLPLTHPGKLPFDPLLDFVPVGMISRLPFFLITAPANNYNTLKELMADAKSKPGRLPYASNGIGSMGHVGTAMLTQSAAVDMIHVPYQGFPPAISDLVTGRVVMVMADLAPVKGQIQAGTLRALAVASNQRSRFMPEIPTLAEAGYPGIEFEIWMALYAPAKTPAHIVTRVGQELKKYLEMPSTREAFAKLGHESDSAGPEVVKHRIETELKQMLPVVKAAGLFNK
ncbi:MAG: tripartite tricarboxylate transporter substrate binding protein [Betaproteobacteria bacterium]|jgi:tripartite-type tricarboxylate transporter receptor subunit TctC